MNRNGIVPAINLRPLSSSYLCLDRPVRAWFDITQDKYDEERCFLHCLFTRSVHFFQNFSVPVINSSLLKRATTMPKKRRSSQNVEAATTAKRVKSDNGLLWRLVTDHPDIFDTHVVPKLNGNDVKFFYDVNTESRAAIKRSGVQLRNAFKIGDFDTKSTISWALEKCNEEKERFCSRVALNGNLDLLKYLHENGCPWDQSTCTCASLVGHLECLQYAHENECPWDEDTCKYAAEKGHLECLKYLHENGCPWDEDTCEGAARNGHLECLKYLHDKGCPWDGMACSAAAGGGHLECLKYAHEHGCPWFENTCYSAACLKWSSRVFEIRARKRMSLG